MTLDARLEVYAQINGTDMPVVSGSTSDSFLEGSGWVLTSGQLVLAGTITAPIGSLCRLSYRSAHAAGAMPRPRLRILRCTPDPMRRTTEVELGCLLSLCMDKAMEPSPPDVWVDWDSPEWNLVDSASNLIRAGLDGAGIPYTGLPSINASILKDFAWKDGYLKKVGEILHAFNYFGYMGPDEVLRFGSVNHPSLSGPSLTLDDLVDIKPLTGGTRPGATIYGRGRYFGSPRLQPTRVTRRHFTEEDMTVYDDAGLESDDVWGGQSIYFPVLLKGDNGETVGGGNVGRQEVGFTKEAYKVASYDRYGRVLFETETQWDHSFNVNSAHAEECISFASGVSPVKDENGNRTPQYWWGCEAASCPVSYEMVSSIVETEYTYENFDIPSGSWHFSEEEWAVAIENYNRQAAAARVVSQITRKKIPMMGVVGSSGVRYCYVEDKLDSNGDPTGEQSFSVLSPGGTSMVTIEEVCVDTSYISDTTTEITTTRTLYGPASQQGASGSAATKFKNASQAAAYVVYLLGCSKTEVTHEVKVTRDKKKGDKKKSKSGAPVTASVGDTWARVTVNTNDVVPNTYQFYDCPVTFAVISTVTMQEESYAAPVLDAFGNQVEPEETGGEGGLPPTGPDGSIIEPDVAQIVVHPVYMPSPPGVCNAYAQGFLSAFAQAQNSLVLAFRQGHQITTTIDKLPITPGAVFHLNDGDSMASYRVNGLNVVFDNRQCLVSVDALYWGAAG